jgi:hypothetical protein
MAIVGPLPVLDILQVDILLIPLLKLPPWYLFCHLIVTCCVLMSHQIALAIAEWSTGCHCRVEGPSDADGELANFRTSAKTYLSSIREDNAEVWRRFCERVYSAAASSKKPVKLTFDFTLDLELPFN